MRSARIIESCCIERRVVADSAAGPRQPPPTLRLRSCFYVDADRPATQPGQGRLNYSLRMYLEPKEEFKQIFNEGWRNQRDYLYVPNMHGSDWPKMKEMYGQLLPYVMHRADLNYLLDMMGAEIAIGHSYVRGGDMPSVPQSVGGLLGADFTIENGRYKVTRIYDNESWNTDLRSPLATPGANVSVGEYILAINGVELNAPDNIHRLLDGTANRQTALTVNTTSVHARSAHGNRGSRSEVSRHCELAPGLNQIDVSLKNSRMDNLLTSISQTPGNPDTAASIVTTSRSRTRRERSRRTF